MNKEHSLKSGISGISVSIVREAVVLVREKDVDVEVRVYE